MKKIRRFVFIAVFFALTLAINSTAWAIIIIPDPPVSVTEWMTGDFTGQYGVSIDSTGTSDWYIQWIAVESQTATGAWTTRPGWKSEYADRNDGVMTATNFNTQIVNEYGWSGPLATTNYVIGYYNWNGLNIGPNEYDNRFYWEALSPSSQYWVGLSLIDNLPADEYTEMIIHGEAASPIPEPATLFLLGTGLAGIGAIRRKRANRA